MNCDLFSLLLREVCNSAQRRMFDAISDLAWELILSKRVISLFSMLGIRIIQVSQMNTTRVLSYFYPVTGKNNWIEINKIRKVTVVTVWFPFAVTHPHSSTKRGPCSLTATIEQNLTLSTWLDRILIDCTYNVSLYSIQESLLCRTYWHTGNNTRTIDMRWMWM